MSKELIERLRAWTIGHCDIMYEAADRIEELEREVERLKEDHGQACLLVAKMHAAAVGEITGPKRGVVEDVEDLRLERDALQADNARLRDAIDDLLSRNPTSTTTVKIAEAIAATPEQSLARHNNRIKEA